MVPRVRFLPYVTAVALVLLATVQYNWIGQVSDMARQRMEQNLLSAGSQLTADFDREVTRAFLFFHPDPATAPGEQRQRTLLRFERWQAGAPYPELIQDVFLVTRTAEGTEGGLQVEVLRQEPLRFEKVAWPAVLDPVRLRLEVQDRALLPVAPELPGLIIPATFSRTLPGWTRMVRGEAEEHLVVRFDPVFLEKELLPELAVRHFGPAGESRYQLAVLAGRAGRPERPVYVSHPGTPLRAFRSPDLRLPMFGLRSFEELHGMWREAGRRRPGLEALRHGGGHGLGDDSPDHFRDESGDGPRAAVPRPGWRQRRGVAPWQLVVRHRRGSLEHVVDRIRWHNAMISLSILTLLAGTAAMMTRTARQAERLARQQLEFVAGVSHELNTPLAAIRSAGQNLADGVVTDPAQVRRYGTLVESEGRRLSGMVGQVLEFAGIQSGRRVYHLQPARVEEILEGALSDSRWLLEQKGFQVEKEIAPDLPAVAADAAALRRAIQNLIENAIKYDGQERWIGVSARRGGDGGVEVTVADRGTGIEKEDLPRLFEPFYRGRTVAAAGSIPGSGLGLSVVRHIAEAHGGRVTVESGGPGQGSAFTIHLPIHLPAAESEA